MSKSITIEDFNERSLLSSIIYSDSIDVDFIDTILNYVPERMFTNPLNRKVHKLIEEIRNEDGENIVGTKYFSTKITLIAQLELSGLDRHIMDMSEQYVSHKTWRYWAKKIQEKYFEQKFSIAKSKEEFEDIIEEQQNLSLETDMCSVADGAEEVITQYENAKKSAIFTPYPSLNKAIGSLQGGDMITFAGSTGGGKTCFMLNLALGMAEAGKRVDIFSLEMPRWQLQQRMICSRAEIDCKKFRAFSLTDEDKKKYFDYANNEFKQLPIRIYKKQSVGIEAIRNIEMKSNADIVFIDYLGLINSYNNRNTYDKVSEISRQIKLLAMQSNKPIVALHQLNRSFQERDDKTPKTSDLRDSGKIEQDSDMIWFVYRPGLFDNSVSQEKMKFIVAKNRHGDTNVELDFVFNGQNQRVSEPIKMIV